MGCHAIYSIVIHQNNPNWQGPEKPRETRCGPNQRLWFRQTEWNTFQGRDFSGLTTEDWPLFSSSRCSLLSWARAEKGKGRQGRRQKGFETHFHFLKLLPPSALFVHISFIHFRYSFSYSLLIRIKIKSGGEGLPFENVGAGDKSKCIEYGSRYPLFSLD